mgnify:FL=1
MRRAEIYRSYRHRNGKPGDENGVAFHWHRFAVLDHGFDVNFTRLHDICLRFFDSISKRMTALQSRDKGMITLLVWFNDNGKLIFAHSSPFMVTGKTILGLYTQFSNQTAHVASIWT